MFYWDTHCHITDNLYKNENLDNIINKMKEDGINCISMATDLNDAQKLIDYSSKYDNIYFGVGIHPYEAHKYTKINDYHEKINNFIKKILNNNKLLFLGEVGIDLYREEQIKTKNEQIELFEYFVYLSYIYDLPLSIHSRNAEKEIIYILKKYNKKKYIKAVFHCYTIDDEDINKEILNNNWYIGLGGIITFNTKKNQKLIQIIKNFDINNILVETDSPYLTPEPHRGKNNYPYYISIIYNQISFLKKINLNELKYIIFENLKRITNKKLN